MPDYLIGPGTGTSAYLLGSEVFGDYWAERYFLDRFSKTIRDRLPHSRNARLERRSTHGRSYDECAH